MTLPPIKLWHVLALVLAAPVAMVFYGDKSNHPSVRCRLTVEPDANGKALTASSIIEAHDVIVSDGNGLRFHSDVRGVAPIVDLGRDGTLNAAMSYDATDLSNRQTATKAFPAYRMPTDAAHIPLRAVGVPPKEIRAAKRQAQLDPKSYPPLPGVQRQPASGKL
jgi:hypothetical protein